MRSGVDGKKRKRGTKRILTWLNSVVGILVSVAAIAWLVRSIDWPQLVVHLTSVKPFYLVLAFATTLLSYVLRSVRWPFFFKFNEPDFWASFRCLIVGFFMNNILPARIGELVRAHWGGRATSQSRTYVLATIAGERLADGLMISILFAVLFPLSATALQYQQERAIYLVAYGFAGASLLTVVLLLLRHVTFRIFDRIAMFFPAKVIGHALQRIRFFIEGLEPILIPRRLIPIAALSLAIWSVELLAYYEVMLAFSQKLSIGGLSLFLAVVNFSSLIPSAPGAVGTIEAIATTALSQIGVDWEAALSMVASQHLLQFIAVGVPGLYYVLKGINQKALVADIMIDESDDEEDRKQVANLTTPGA